MSVVELKMWVEATITVVLLDENRIGIMDSTQTLVRVAQGPDRDADTAGEDHLIAAVSSALGKRKGRKQPAPFALRVIGASRDDTSKGNPSNDS